MSERTNWDRLAPAVKKWLVERKIDVEKFLNPPHSKWDYYFLMIEIMRMSEAYKKVEDVPDDLPHRAMDKVWAGPDLRHDAPEEVPF